METKTLVIAVIEKNGKILLRKKPEGSLPYKETWYLFGATLDSENNDPQKTIVKYMKKLTGIDIKFIKELGRDTEIKKDVDGEEKLFVYLDCLCEYVSGELSWGEGIEKLEWVSKDELKNYDLVPPSRNLFKKMKYLE